MREATITVSSRPSQRVRAKRGSMTGSARAGTDNHRELGQEDSESQRGSINASLWLWVPAFAGTTPSALPLHERLFDHEVAGRAAAAFDEVARLEHPLELVQHRRAAAHHDTVGRDIERSLMHVVEELTGGNEVRDAATVAERFARHGRIIQQLLR